MYILTIFALIPVIGFLLLVYIADPIKQIIKEIETHPQCLGVDNICHDFRRNRLFLEYKTFSNVFYNFISVKNVYFANYNGTSVVIKKSDVFYEDNNFYHNDSFKNFKLCSESDFKELATFAAFDILKRNLIKNAELFLLTLFSYSEGFPVPRYFGCCGRYFVSENCGEDLNNFQDVNWIGRANLALQLLQAANKFTEGHGGFRLYLTDISPDNIVVSREYKVTFIDLDNALLTSKKHGTGVHFSHHFVFDDYAYSENDICKSRISDHNIYSICRLLLSRNAPWPMMSNGLLHSPPEHIKEKYSNLFEDLEACVEQKNRFNISRKIMFNLKKIILQESANNVI